MPMHLLNMWSNIYIRFASRKYYILEGPHFFYDYVQLILLITTIKIMNAPNVPITN